MTTSQTTFNHELVIVVYVLGGPGAGKGTQCHRLVEEFRFEHLSAGDLLREEQNKKDSPYAQMIQTYIREGIIVPMEVTIKLLENSMKKALESRAGEPGWEDGRGRFLIDGFPRKMDQALKFDETVCLASLVLYFDCDEDTMLKRLLERGKTSGREDDNVESIKKRFVVYKEQTKPVIEHYGKVGKVATVDSKPSVDVVYGNARQAVSLLPGIN